MNPVRASNDFPQTSWGRVAVACDPAHPDRVAAINRLIEQYWRPTFCCLRRLGHATELAEDLTQEFFTSVFGEQLSQADPNEGRFRDLLYTLLRRFAYDRTVRARLQERYERGLVSVHALMQDSDRSYEPPDDQTPEQVFHAQWKADTLVKVGESLRAYYEHHDSAEERQRFAIYAALHCVAPGEKPPTQEEVAESFGLSRDQVRYAVKQVQARFERFLRQELRDQLGDDDVEDGLRELLG